MAGLPVKFARYTYSIDLRLPGSAGCRTSESIDLRLIAITHTISSHNDITRIADLPSSTRCRRGDNDEAGVLFPQESKVSHQEVAQPLGKQEVLTGGVAAGDSKQELVWICELGYLVLSDTAPDLAQDGHSMCLPLCEQGIKNFNRHLPFGLLGARGCRYGRFRIRSFGRIEQLH